MVRSRAARKPLTAPANVGKRPSGFQDLRRFVDSARHHRCANLGEALLAILRGFLDNRPVKASADHRDQSVVRNGQVLHVLPHRPPLRKWLPRRLFFRYAGHGIENSLSTAIQQSQATSRSWSVIMEKS